ncbi:hypothetical protein HOLleu_16327 [Holothuria leucospilota]|uniref:TIL domain-containing protein n=1 Tax=Holothuria leucospilota TaxID=206669 RepID=A0A9Q1C6I0_HOLLE|nr:hypothetical protein HOLleu_16327 [Holothuria leucospilota]
MVWGNCTCMATCKDPKAKISCYYSSCSGDEGCYCPSGFLMEREHCIPRNECGCFLPEADEVLPLFRSFAFLTEGSVSVRSDSK